MLAIFKKYISKDNQEDIFGENYKLIQTLHKNASKQYYNLIPVVLSILKNRLCAQQYSFNSKSLDNLQISVDPQQGRLLYNLVLANRPEVIFEFGLSHGISAIYICHAMKKLESQRYKSRFYSCEAVDKKISIAKKNMSKLGISEMIHIIKGDILQQAEKIPDNIDFIHMDGFPNINLDVLKILEPKMSPNCLIITDDLNLFRYEMKEYLNYLHQNKSYSNLELNISDGVLMTIKQ